MRKILAADLTRANLARALRRLAAGLALVLAVAAPAAAADPQPLVSVDWLKSHLGDPDLVVLDIRSAIDGGGLQAYTAAHIPGSVHAAAYGHIPGALSLDSGEFYDAKANRLRPKAELAAIATQVPAGPVVSYRNTGHWAATDWFVMHELLGRARAKLYAGSMVEWTADANRPVESARTKWDDLKKKLGLGS